MAIVITPDNKYALSGGWDKTSGQVSQTFKGHLERITSVALSGAGKVIVTASDDKTIACGTQSRAARSAA